MSYSEQCMLEALKLAEDAVESGLGGPFGAVVARDGEIIGRGQNQVTSSNDPTAHAEVNAIRDACHNTDNFSLRGCAIYTSCEPCPMCLAAIYWARIETIYYGNTRADAANIGFDDDFLYRELAIPIADRTIAMNQILAEEAQKAFQTWRNKADRIDY